MLHSMTSAVMTFDLMKIFHEMDGLARAVTFSLLAMGVASLTVFIERTVALARSVRQSRALASVAAGLLAGGRYDELRAAAEERRASHLGRLLAAGITCYRAASERLGSRASIVEVLRRELARKHEDAAADLRRGLNVLASVGSVAPFVGLLGTVVGIIAAFTKISVTGSGGLSSVAGGISEALVVTALGLIVAIPAVLLFNRVSAQADAIHQQLGTAVGELVDHFEFYAAEETARRDGIEKAA